MGNTARRKPPMPEPVKFESSASVTIASSCSDWKGFAFSDLIGVVRLLWTRSHSAVIRQLSTNLIREIAAFLLLPESFLTRVRETGLQWFDVRTNRWSEPMRFSCAVDFFDFASFLVLDSKRVFASEAGAYSHDRKNYLLERSAYLITADCASGSGLCEVERLPDMIVGHRGAGLIRDNGSVYLFGGNCYTGQSNLHSRRYFLGRYHLERQ